MSILHKSPIVWDLEQAAKSFLKIYWNSLRCEIITLYSYTHLHLLITFFRILFENCNALDFITDCYIAQAYNGK